MRRRTPEQARQAFSARVLITEAGCWEWTGAKSGPGYGEASYQGRRQMAHRVFWQLYRGDIPEGMEIDHLCRNRPCCNPDHLELVTHAENMERYGQTITHCKNGHAFTPENTYREGRRRKCRACRAEYVRQFNQRNPEANAQACQRYQAKRGRGAT